jgi:cold shock CspA family protein
VTDRDRDFRPARRHDFDDDDYQPPSGNFGYAPPRGPQFDSPSGPPVGKDGVDASTAVQEQPRRARLERPSADRPTVEETGTVKWYNSMKGFGFIGPDQGGKDIFVHVSALERSGIMGLAEDQRVAVDVAEGQKGPEPVSLRLI